MIPLVDMMICERLHVVDASMDIMYATFSFTCDTLPKNNVDHVDSPICDDGSLSMPSYACFHFSPLVACNMSNNLHFTRIACNNVNMLEHEFAPTASSIFGVPYFNHVEHSSSFIVHDDHPHTSHFHFDFRAAIPSSLKCDSTFWKR